MNTFQWVMLAAAIFLVAPVVFEKFKGLISSAPTSPPVPPAPEHVNICDGLVDVVKCWEHLCDCCEAQGMEDAARELKEIFPLFVIQEVKNE
jgi:hypothetical protein